MDGEQKCTAIVVSAIAAAVVGVMSVVGVCWSIGNYNDTTTRISAFQSGYEQAILPGSTYVQWVKAR